MAEEKKNSEEMTFVNEISLEKELFENLGLKEHLFKSKLLKTNENKECILSLDGKDGRKEFNELKLKINDKYSIDVTKYIVQLFTKYEYNNNISTYIGTATIINIQRNIYPLLSLLN